MRKISIKIIDYAIRYYLRYYPSPKKLYFKLEEKFWSKSGNAKKYWWISSWDIDFILTEKLKNIIKQEEVIESKVKNYMNKWKSKLYIKQKMFLRMENMNLVEKHLKNYFQDIELENIKKHLKKLWYFSNLEYNKKQKILQKLFIKGFKYDDIKKVL